MDVFSFSFLLEKVYLLSLKCSAKKSIHVQIYNEIFVSFNQYVLKLNTMYVSIIAYVQLPSYFAEMGLIPGLDPRFDK